MAETTKPNPGRAGHDADVIDRILARLEDGAGLVEICAEPRMPNRQTFLRWVGNDRDGLARRHARARDTGLEVQAQRLLELADEAMGLDHARVQGVRLKIDTLRWYLSKLAPERYGGPSTSRAR